MINSTLCYIEKDGKYLMLHRVKKENDVNRDKWIGIGGKFEDGESPEECVLREVREETGLTLNSWRYQSVITFVSDRWETEYMHLFHSEDFSGEILDCDEGTLEWIEKDKLLSLPIWEGDKIFLRLMDEKPPFFSLKLRYEGEVLKEAVLNGKPYKHKPLRAIVKRVSDKSLPEPVTPPKPENAASRIYHEEEPTFSEKAKEAYKEFKEIYYRHYSLFTLGFVIAFSLIICFIGLLWAEMYK